MENQTKFRNNMDLRIDFFKPDLKSDKLQQTFQNIFKENNGNWSVIKTKLAGKKGFMPEVINNLEFTYRLAEWSNDNNQLNSIFQGGNQIHSMRDITAKFNKAAFIDRVKDIAPADSEEDKKAFALSLHREPTALLVNMIRDPQVPMLNNAVGANVAAVLAKQPNFNIKTTSVYEVINNAEALKDVPVENRETVITQLKTLQRITEISPDTDALPVLYNANLHSVMQITTMPSKQFMAVISKSGLDDDTLRQIHSNAQKARVRNEQAIMALTEAARGTGVAMMDRSLNRAAAATMKIMSLEANANADSAPSIQETLAKHNLSWDLLFVDADFCECSECNSVYIAATYYVSCCNIYATTISI